MAQAKAKSVFELFAHEYDLITNATQREPQHKREVDAIIRRVSPGSVLDAGCASGLTTLLFASRGVEAVGLDRSRAMLSVARKKVVQSDLPVSFVSGQFEKLPKRLSERFDLVVCLANGISGVGTMSNLHRSTSCFYNALKPGGYFVLQMLNYRAVKEGTLFPIKATENKGIVYERFSERRGNRLAVYVTRLDLNDPARPLQVFRHEFSNFEPDTVMRSVQRAGFDQIKRFGDLMFSRRFSLKGRDLIIVGRRPPA